MEKTSHFKLLGVLLIIGYFFLMAGNGLVSLTHPDEVFYMQTAKEMDARDSWLTPYIFDEPQFEKPLFFYTLLRLSIKFAGLDPFWARFWPSFFAILGMGITYWMGWMLFRSKRAAFLSAFILGTSFIYLALARAILTDMVFSVIVVASLAFFYWGYITPRKKNSGIIFCFAFAGLAVLTKGVFGFLFPATVIGAFLFFKKDFGYLKNRATMIGGFLFLLISVPWHVHMYQLYGDHFVNDYWWNVHVKRIYDAEHERSNTWYFYLGTMLGGMMPWSFFLVPGSYWTYRQLRNNASSRQPVMFLFAWILLIWACVQPAHSKLASYHFAVFPALAILTANFIDNILKTKEDRFLSRVMAVAPWIMVILLFGAAVFAIIFAKQNIDMVVDMTSPYVFCGLSALLAVAMIIFIRSRRDMAVVFAHGGIIVVVLATLFLGRMYAEPWVSCKQVADQFVEMDQSDTTVLCSKFYVRGIRYYTDRKVAVIDINGDGFFTPHPIPFLNSDNKVLEFLESQDKTFAIVKDSNVDDLKRIAGRGNFKVSLLNEIADKYILKIEKVKN